MEDRQIEAKDIKKLLLRVYKRYTSGAITDVQAQRETYILNSILKAIETVDIEERLKNIEIILKSDK
jgi:hypothetical protein